MKVLIVGSGGREYSIGLALKKDKKINKIYFAPGNGGTLEIGENISILDFNQLANFAKENQIDLTIVGPEEPLVNGIVDVFKAQDLCIFGPNKCAARLEGSKAFMKNFLSKNSIPTAKYIETTSKEEAKKFINTLSCPIVVKADGLCAGKGVIIAKTKEEALREAALMLSGESFGDAGKKIIIEEFLDGFELSIFAICDGENYKLLPAAQDHKRLLDNDEGPNTGGMGAYAPTPLASEKIYKQIEDEVIKPTLTGMKNEGCPYEGVLFIGIIVVNGKPYVLEYNVRFGDPECEVLMPLLKTPALELFHKAANKKLHELKLEFNDIFVLAVVMASKNYPFSSSSPTVIKINKNKSKNAHIVFAGVSKTNENLTATGGRVLLCVGEGNTLKDAKKEAYNLCDYVHFDGCKFRKDIGYLAINE